MRGAPHVEFSCAIVWIMDRISPDVVGLPTVLLRERKRQYRRKPCRCHPATVSGLTIRSDLAQCGQKWRSRIQNSRSERCNRGRLVRRFKTINWCRKATISKPQIVARSTEALQPSEYRRYQPMHQLAVISR